MSKFKNQSLYVGKKKSHIRLQGRLEVSEAQGQNFEMRPLVSVIAVSRGGRKQGNLGRLNLEALSEPCRLFLLGGSLNTS